MELLPDLQVLFERYHLARKELRAGLLAARSVTDEALARLARLDGEAEFEGEATTPSRGARAKRRAAGTVPGLLLRAMLGIAKPALSSAVVAAVGSAMPGDVVRAQLSRLRARGLVHAKRVHSPTGGHANLYRISKAGRRWLARGRNTTPTHLPPEPLKAHPQYRGRGAEAAVIAQVQQASVPLDAAQLTQRIRAQFPRVEEAVLRKRVNTALYNLRRRGAAQVAGSRHGPNGSTLRSYTAASPPPTLTKSVRRAPPSPLLTNLVHQILAAASGPISIATIAERLPASQGKPASHRLHTILSNLRRRGAAARAGWSATKSARGHHLALFAVGPKPLHAPRKKAA